MMIRRSATITLSTLLAFAGCGERVPQGQPLQIFGRTGVGDGEFNYPRAAVAAAGERVFIVDKAGRIQSFRQDGSFIRQWRMPQISAGRPTGLGVGPGGRLFVADTHYNRVMIFDFDGRRIGEFGQAGKGPGQFGMVIDVKVDRDGFIYVSEFGGNDRISKFTADLKYLFSFGGPHAGEARLARPQSLCPSPDGTLWVADAGNHRICHFDADGRFLGSFGSVGDALGRLRFPYDIDLLSDGTLVVCEYGNNRVQRFTPVGESLGVWGGPGRKPGELAYPWALAVCSGDRIFVIDSGNNRVQVINGLDKRTWRREASHEAP